LELSAGMAAHAAIDSADSVHICLMTKLPRPKTGQRDGTLDWIEPSRFWVLGSVPFLTGWRRKQQRATALDVKCERVDPTLLAGVGGIPCYLDVEVRAVPALCILAKNLQRRTSAKNYLSTCCSSVGEKGYPSLWRRCIYYHPRISGDVGMES
jgi:hypothetical protein